MDWVALNDGMDGSQCVEYSLNYKIKKENLIINFGSLYNFISIKVLLTDGIIDYDFISLAVVTFFRYISVPLYVFSLLETCIANYFLAFSH